MTSRQALASTLHLFVVFAFFGAGFFCVSLPYLPELRVRVADALLSRFEVCTLLGLGFFATSLLLLLGFYSLNRGQFLRIVMGRHLVEIDTRVIRSTVEDCFKRKFPTIALQDLEIIWGRKLEIGVVLGAVENEEELLERVEKELSQLLRHRFGYKKPFALILKQ